MVFWLLSVKIDKNVVDPYTLNLCISRSRANFLTANTDSESPGDKLSNDIETIGIGGGRLFHPYLSAVLAQKATASR